MGSHKARVFRHRAEEFRELALSMRPSERQAMLRTADDYEHIAALVEKNRQHANSPDSPGSIEHVTGHPATAEDGSASASARASIER